MSDFEKVIDALKDVDMDDVKVVVNVAGGIMVAGKEIYEILQKDGGLTQVDLVQIVNDKDVSIAINRARLVQSIKDRKGS